MEVTPFYGDNLESSSDTFWTRMWPWSIWIRPLGDLSNNVSL